MIELALVADRDGVAAAVASVFMVQPQADRSWRDVVVDALRGREVLLVIDNCEHVLDEVAGLIEAIVGSCPMVRVLVTSRESLSVGAEWAWRVRRCRLVRTRRHRRCSSNGPTMRRRGMFRIVATQR